MRNLGGYLKLHVAVLLLFISSVSFANNTDELIQNGSFEKFKTVKDYGDWKVVRLEHWSKKAELWSENLGEKATDGEYKIELDRNRKFNFITQTISTQESKKYRFSLDAYARETKTSDFEVFLNNKSILKITPTAQWEKYSVDFIGKGKDEQISIKEISSQSKDGLGAIIDNVSVKELSNTKHFPSDFFISATKAYAIAKKEGINLNSYSYGYKIYKDFIPSEMETWKEVIKRSNTEDNFIIVIAYGKWGKIMGSRKGVVKQLQDPKKIYKYLDAFKQTMIKLSEAKGSVLVGFEPDPMAYFMGLMRRKYQNNPSNLPAKIMESNFPEALEINPPQNFAGFWQVIDYIREKYAPNVMLAPTIKTWGIPTDPKAEPVGGWSSDDAGVRTVIDYYQNYGVNWDALAFNYNPGKVHDDKNFKTIARYITAIAGGMSNDKTGMRVRPYLWKTKITKEHYDGTPQKNWHYDDISFEMRNIQFLADLGFTGINLGYGNEIAKPNKLPPLVECWLKEYFQGEEGECTPHGTIGVVEVIE
jgi:hypothetical protein